MSGAAGAEDEVRQLVKLHGALMRKEGNGSERWRVGKLFVQVPAPWMDEAAWLGARAHARRAVRALDLEREAIVAVNGGAAEKAPSARMALKTKGETIVLQQGKAGAGDLALMLMEEALSVGARAELLEIEVRSLVEALAQANRRVEALEGEAKVLEQKLSTKSAEFAKFNGRDWPAELAAAEARTRAATDRVAGLEAKVAHLEQALRSLMLAGGGK